MALRWTDVHRIAEELEISPTRIHRDRWVEQATDLTLQDESE